MSAEDMGNEGVSKESGFEKSVPVGTKRSLHY